MLQEWLGRDQTIDLGQWAMCLGLRKAYLDTLPNRRWAGHLVTLDERQKPQELLRITLDEGKIRLRFLSPDLLNISGTPTDDIVSLAARVAAASPADPPSLFTILMDGRALGDLLIAATAEPERAKIFYARLAAGYGRHWGVHAITEIGRSLVTNILRKELVEQLATWSGQNETRTLVFHREGAPATRGGVVLAKRQFRMLAPEELISVPGAIWIDERFVGDSIDLLDRMLKKPPKNPLAIYSELNALLKRNYLQLADKKSIPLMRILPDLFKATWFKSKAPAAPGAPPIPTGSEKLTLALYFQPSSATTAAEAAQLYGPLIEMLLRYPQVKATVGWTEQALNESASTWPDVLHSYSAGVKNGQFETTCVLDALPFPMLPLRDLVRTQIQSWESTAARVAQLWAKGFVPTTGNLSPGWGDALSGSEYQYIALPESLIRRANIKFDPTRPISIEGWPVVGFHRESSRLLRLGVDDDVLGEYIQYLAADYEGKTLPVAIEWDTFSDLSRLERFLKLAQAQGCTFVVLSELASAHAQGTANSSPDFAGLEKMTSTEPGRQLNAAFAKAWDRWLATRTLGERIQAKDKKGALQDAQHLISSIACGHSYRARPRAGVESGMMDTALANAELVISRSQDLVDHWLLQLGPLMTLPEHALGVVRLFEPFDLERKGNLLTVRITLPEGMLATSIAFMDHGMVIPSQWLGTQNGQECFLLVLDMNACGFKDLVVLPDVLSVSPEGLDITSNRLCNPWLAILLDQRGQVTSIRFQGREHLCGPGNRIRGYMLGPEKWLRADLVDAEIAVASPGPIYGEVIVRQRLAGHVELVRHLYISLSNPLLECTTELHFPTPVTMAEKLIVGAFDLLGEQAIWSLPLEAGSTFCEAAQAPPVIFSAQDAIDVRTGWHGLRYMAHQATTRTYQYAAKPVAQGLRLGLIASTPAFQSNLARLGDHSGLGFPGHTYQGRYTYRYAVHPISPDVEAHTAFYNHPLLWSFYPQRR
ncbi:MAG: hypothetical protein JXA89_00655 [Anaerolineae bacterium]|nr:hypothetical protein [Anaerolineae bacterium]